MGIRPVVGELAKRRSTEDARRGMCTRLGQSDSGRSTSGQRHADDSEQKNKAAHKGQEGNKKGQKNQKVRPGYVLNLSVVEVELLARGAEPFLAKADIAPIWKRGIRSRRGCVRALVERRSALSVA